MTLSKSIHRYDAIAGHLHTIIQHDVTRRVFSSPKAAMHWRAMAYMYRALLGQRDGSTLFDHLIFRITKSEPNVVTILKGYEEDGYFETADGRRVDPVLTPEDEALQTAARELGKKLNKLGILTSDKLHINSDIPTSPQTDHEINLAIIPLIREPGQATQTPSKTAHQSDVERNQFGFDAFGKGK